MLSIAHAPPRPGAIDFLVTWCLCGAYAAQLEAKMADDEEAEQEPRGHSCSSSVLRALLARLEDLSAALRGSAEPAEEATAHYCRVFCQVCPPQRFFNKRTLAH